MNYRELKEIESSDPNIKTFTSGNTKIEIKLENNKPKIVTINLKNPTTGNEVKIEFEQGKITVKEGENGQTMNLKTEEFNFEKLLELVK